MDYSGWFGDTVRWYIVLVLITWGFAPAVRWLLGGLADKGASVARPAALLFVLWPAWFLSGSVKLPFTSWGSGSRSPSARPFAGAMPGSANGSSGTGFAPY